MATLTEIEYYELLKKSLPEDAARATVAYIGERNEKTLTVERAKEIFATKEDLAKLETSLTVKIYTIGIGLGLLQVITVVGAMLVIVKFANP